MLKPKFQVALTTAASLSLLTSISAFGQDPVNRGARDSARAEEVIKNWKDKPQQVAREVLKKYGAPQEITEQRLVWHGNGPWKRTELINEEIDHQFPMPHKDMLLQVIDYEVPSDKFDELAAFDGSVVAERTRGELAARCDKEEANILALNLAHEIVTGKRSVEDARKVYGEQIVASASGQPAPLTAKLNVRSQRGAGDPDRITLAQATVDKVQAMMKAKEQEKKRQMQ
jgi:hypothetical protein